VFSRSATSPSASAATVSDAADLEEWAAASEAPDLSADDLERIAELYERNFDVEPVRA